MALNLIGFECQCEFEVFPGVSGKLLKVLEQEGDLKLVTLWKIDQAAVCGHSRGDPQQKPI